jgi:hypothetical protein
VHFGHMSQNTTSGLYLFFSNYLHVGCETLNFYVSRIVWHRDSISFFLKLHWSTGVRLEFVWMTQHSALCFIPLNCERRNNIALYVFIPLNCFFLTQLVSIYRKLSYNFFSFEFEHRRMGIRLNVSTWLCNTRRNLYLLRNFYGCDLKS